MNTNRDWEDGYRSRWQHDKVVRSTHGVNCTGSCSWKIYVKNGPVTGKLSKPTTRAPGPICPTMSRAAAARRQLLVPVQRQPAEIPADAQASAQAVARGESAAQRSGRGTGLYRRRCGKAKSYKVARGRGGFVRSSWQEVNELIAAANVYTAKTFGPDRIIGFSPIPAMSMVSYAAGARYLSLIGGACLSFYDWYCDLPPASPMTRGEQTDVPESADWYNSSYIIAGAPTCRRRAPRTPTSLPKCVTRAPKPWR